MVKSVSFSLWKSYVKYDPLLGATQECMWMPIYPAVERGINVVVTWGIRARLLEQLNG